MAEEGEAGASVHLPFDHFRLVVHSFRAPVVVREGERGGGCLDVQVQAAGEGVEVREVGGAGAGDPFQELVLVGGVGVEHGGEFAGQPGQGFHLRACC